MTDCNNCDFDKYCTRDTCIDDINPKKDILEEILEAWEETKEHFGIEGDLIFKLKRTRD